VVLLQAWLIGPHEDDRHGGLERALPKSIAEAGEDTRAADDGRLQHHPSLAGCRCVYYLRPDPRPKGRSLFKLAAL
jgi:hypothetical protein